MIASRQTLLVTVENKTFCKIFTGPLPIPFEFAPHPVKVPGPLGFAFGGGIRISRMRELKVRVDAKRACKREEISIFLCKHKKFIPIQYHLVQTLSHLSIQDESSNGFAQFQFVLLLAQQSLNCVYQLPLQYSHGWILLQSNIALTKIILLKCKLVQASRILTVSNHKSVSIAALQK